MNTVLFDGTGYTSFIRPEKESKFPLDDTFPGTNKVFVEKTIPPPKPSPENSRSNSPSNSKDDKKEKEKKLYDIATEYDRQVAKEEEQKRNEISVPKYMPPPTLSLTEVSKKTKRAYYKGFQNGFFRGIAITSIIGVVIFILREKEFI